MKYLSSGTFPKITSSTGLASIKEFLEKTRYPISKSVLIKKLGWRIVETEEGRQASLATVLADLPSKTYKNVEELLRDAKQCAQITDHSLVTSE